MPEPTFHFFTLVTKDDQYAAMRESLAAVGFNEENAVFTLLDNRRENAHEPYSALTAAVRTAEAPYVVFCHQDLVFRHGPDDLRAALAALDALDPTWAVAGNAGCTPEFASVTGVDEPGGPLDFGTRPGRVVTLDENLLVVRRDAGVGCSPELSGFHLYGTDLSLNAYAKGRSVYVIEYRVLHLGTTLDYAGLYRLALPFVRHWRRRIGGAVLLAPASVLVFSPVPGLYPLLVRAGIAPRLLWRPGLMRAMDRALRPWRPAWLPKT